MHKKLAVWTLALIMAISASTPRMAQAGVGLGLSIAGLKTAGIVLLPISGVATVGTCVGACCSYRNGVVNNSDSSFCDGMICTVGVCVSIVGLVAGGAMLEETEGLAHFPSADKISPALRTALNVSDEELADYDDELPELNAVYEEAQRLEAQLQSDPAGATPESYAAQHRSRFKPNTHKVAGKIKALTEYVIAHPECQNAALAN